MKNQVKKISFLMVSILFVISCNNSNSTRANKPSSEPKESFSESVMVKLFKSCFFYDFPNTKETILKNEYESIDELMSNTFKNWKTLKKGEFDPERAEEVKNTIEEAEKMSKSRFFLQRGGISDEAEFIYFTPKEDIGYDMCVIRLGIGFTQLSTEIEKISLKDFVAKTSLYLLHSDMREGVDIKSLGLDPATTEKLLEAQNYKGN